MSDLIQITAQEWQNLKERAATLAKEKSYLQLVNDLMRSLSRVTGVDNTADSIIQIILETLGGSNVALYWRMSSSVFCSDACGRRSAETVIEDPMVAHAFTRQQFIEEEHDFADTHMLTPAFAKASYWALPLMVGNRLVGVIKMEGMLMTAVEMRLQLQPFFNYAALVLHNEIESHAKLIEAAKYATLVQSTDDGIIGIDVNGIVTSWNRGAEKVYGYAQQAITGSSIQLLALPEDAEKIAAILNKIQQGESVERYEAVQRKREGEPVHVSLSAAPIKSEAGRIKGASIVVRDITLRKQAEAVQAKLEAQNRQLQKTESLGRMAGAIAHHFNNKLAAVMLSLEMAGYSVPPQSEVTLHLTSAMKSVRQAVNVSRQMLTCLGESFVPHIPIDLAGTCRAHLSLLQAALPDYVQLAVDLPSPGPAIEADESQIHQVLDQLIANAWESLNQQPGTLRLTLKTVAKEQIMSINRFPITWEPQSGAYACLEIADTGCGIQEGDTEMIFDPFFSRKFVGRGLGLPIALGIVRTHGGGICVKSQPGKGSVFQVFLPISNKPACQEREQTIDPNLFRNGGNSYAG